MQTLDDNPLAKEQILLTVDRKHFAGKSDAEIAANVSGQAFNGFLKERVGAGYSVKSGSIGATLSVKHWSVGPTVVVAVEVMNFNPEDYECKP